MLEKAISSLHEIRIPEFPENVSIHFVYYVSESLFRGGELELLIFAIKS